MGTRHLHWNWLYVGEVESCTISSNIVDGRNLLRVGKVNIRLSLGLDINIIYQSYIGIVVMVLDSTFNHFQYILTCNVSRVS